MKIKLMLVYFFLCLSMRFFGQEFPEGYVDQAKAEISENQVEKALITLNEGLLKHPENGALYFERGILYYSQHIYKRAIKDLLRAESLEYENAYLLYNHIAEIYGLQGHYKKAKEYYHKLLLEYPENEHIVANLLWYYYKTLSIQEGLQIGLNALSKWPQSSSINSMLALLYANLNQYEQAELCYQQAVHISIEEGRYREASQTLYNQAIFENEFYQFQKAQDLLSQAVMLDSHPSSYRLIGETLMNQLLYYPAKEMIDLSESLEISQTEKSRENRTPLGRLVLTELALTFNQLEDAQSLIKQIKELTSEEWITGFGTSREAYLAWLHNLQKKFFKQYALTLKRSITTSFAQHIQNVFTLIKADYLVFYHQKKFEAYSQHVAREMHKQNLLLASYREYIAASGTLNSSKKRFIELSQKIESTFAPASGASYLAQQSLLKNDPKLRDQAITGFDPLYERKKHQYLLQSWIEQLGHSKKRIPLIAQLYDLNRPIVELYGLPVKLAITGDRLYVRKTSQLLKKGLIFASNTPYTLQINLNQGVCKMQLLENENILIEKTLEFAGSKEGVIRLARRILMHLYFPA